MSSGGNFDATRWSLVRQAQGDSERSREALGDLCQAVELRCLIVVELKDLLDVEELFLVDR